MLIENLKRGMFVCDQNEKHQKVREVDKEVKMALLEDNCWHAAEDLDVADHTYLHLVRS